MVAIAVAAGMTASFSESVHQCRGWTSGTAGTATPDPLVVELAQVLVQPQFLSMVQAGTACAERHARSSNIDVMGRMTSSASFMVLTEWWMSCLHTCFCISSPPPLGLASPELQQAALSWLPATLALIKADSWLGAWPADALSKLIHFGLAIPLVILIQRVWSCSATPCPPSPGPTGYCTWSALCRQRSGCCQLFIWEGIPMTGMSVNPTSSRHGRNSIALLIR